MTSQISRRRDWVDRRGFTLVEILVVCSIIAILSAFISAATLRVIASAKSGACASNIHQIDVAAAMYAASNDGFWPPTAMFSVGDSEAEAKLFKAEVAPFGATSRIFFCPLDPHQGDRSHVALFGPEDQTSYCELLGFLAAGKQLSPGPIVTFLATDTDVVDPASCGAFHDRPFPADLHNEYDRDSLTGHGAMQNVAFVDSHVKLLPTGEAARSQYTSGCLPK